MTPKYNLYIEPDAHEERKNLPGHVRQRIQRTITELAENPYSPQSRQLDTSELNLADAITIYRIRLDKWRIIYAVNEEDAWVWVWGIRRRPPYDYQDLPEFLNRLS